MQVHEVFWLLCTINLKKRVESDIKNAFDTQWFRHWRKKLCVPILSYYKIRVTLVILWATIMMLLSPNKQQFEVILLRCINRSIHSNLLHQTQWLFSDSSLYCATFSFRSFSSCVPCELTCTCNTITNLSRITCTAKWTVSVGTLCISMTVVCSVSTFVVIWIIKILILLVGIVLFSPGRFSPSDGLVNDEWFGLRRGGYGELKESGKQGSTGVKWTILVNSPCLFTLQVQVWSLCDHPVRSYG